MLERQRLARPLRRRGRTRRDARRTILRRARNARVVHDPADDRGEARTDFGGERGIVGAVCPAGRGDGVRLKKLLVSGRGLTKASDVRFAVEPCAFPRFLAYRRPQELQSYAEIPS